MRKLILAMCMYIFIDTLAVDIEGCASWVVKGWTGRVYIYIASDTRSDHKLGV